MPDLTHYEILGLAPNATPEEIRKAYKHLAQKHHPDKKPEDEAHYKRITEAYRTLKSPSRRALYDLGVRQGFDPSEFKSMLRGILDSYAMKIVEAAANPTAPKLNFKQALLGLASDDERMAKIDLKNCERALEQVCKALEQVSSDRGSHFFQAVDRKVRLVKIQIHNNRLKLAVLKLIKEEGADIMQKLEEEKPQYITNQVFGTGWST